MTDQAQDQNTCDPNAFDCTNTDCQIWCVNEHQITEDEFNEAIGKFFNVKDPAKFPAPQVFTTQLIADKIAGMPCANYVVYFTYDPRNVTDNSELGLLVAAGDARTYSIPLFNGIFIQYPAATSIEFFKAITTDPTTNIASSDIVFRVMEQNNSVFYADLSRLRP